MECKYYKTCPSCSAWCDNRQPSEQCVEFILIAYDKSEKERYMLQRMIEIMREDK